MSDPVTSPSPFEKHTKPISSFFGSPNLFRGFASKGGSEIEPVMSPTSILDSKPFSARAAKNPFRHDTKIPETFSVSKHPWENLNSRGIGLALIDTLNNKKTENIISKPNCRIVFFGFGSANSGNQTEEPHQALTRCLSAKEMELSEEYTCVISHGPNPKTTHIFDNCIVESCRGVVGLSESKKKFYRSFSEKLSYRPTTDFLSCCFTCKKELGHQKDIYIYRGEKAFCSHECRGQEMKMDGVDNLELDDAFRTRA